MTDKKTGKITGCLCGIGVGPGDPELMTIKAARRLRECPVIAIPQEDKEHCVAYRIAVDAVPEIAEKKCLYLPMPMTKDAEILHKSHENAANQVASCLEAGQDVALITLGDATVYSTYLYIHEKISALGYPTEIVNGIPSFCAAAARLNIPLVNGAEELHIIPASYHIEEALKLSGVKVLMKAGRQMAKVKELLQLGNYEVKMVENCGMPNEKVYESPDDIPDHAGYYSLIIVRENGGK